MEVLKVEKSFEKEMLTIKFLENVVLKDTLLVLLSLQMTISQTLVLTLNIRTKEKRQSTFSCFNL